MAHRFYYLGATHCLITEVILEKLFIKQMIGKSILNPYLLRRLRLFLELCIQKIHHT